MTPDRMRAGVPAGVRADPADPLAGRPTDSADPDLALAATGLLADYNRAGVITSADVHVANRVAGIVRETCPEVVLACALTVRALRHGSVCVDLGQAGTHLAVTDEQRDLPWPDPVAWATLVESSRLVAGPDPGVPAAMRQDAGLLYLDKYWRQECSVAEVLSNRAGAPLLPHDPGRLRSAVRRLFPDDPDQRIAAVTATVRPLSVIAGGPGTGKTTTIARILAVLADQPGPAPRIALAAPTGKAAARLQEAVTEVIAGLDPPDRERLNDGPGGQPAGHRTPLRATTLHRLLVTDRRSVTGFRYGPDLPVPFDVVVIDETSMVPLTAMAHLLAALAPQTRLILVGDPDQLSSVEAGAVLADIVARPAPDPVPGLTDAVQQCVGELSDTQIEWVARGVTHLTRRHRFGGDIADLADAIRDGDPDRTMEVIARPGEAITLSEDVEELRDLVIDSGHRQWEAAAAADADAALAQLTRHRLLCAHRRGPFGAAWWSETCRRWLIEAVPDYPRTGRWFLGRPLLVLNNNDEVGIYNGDTGVVVADGTGVRAAFPGVHGPRLVATSRLRDVDTLYAMTIHKSQGSQFGEVSILLPPPESPLLTRELLYTAVTRAQERVRLIGTAESVAAAIRRPIQRASGLRNR